jgi:hypothetical protein
MQNGNASGKVLEYNAMFLSNAPKLSGLWPISEQTIQDIKDKFLPG